MKKIRIRKRRSVIGRPLRQKRTMEALGLRRINQVVEHDNNATMQGMIRKVAHLITVEQINP